MKVCSNRSQINAILLEMKLFFNAVLEKKNGFFYREREQVRERDKDCEIYGFLQTVTAFLNGDGDRDGTTESTEPIFYREKECVLGFGRCEGEKEDGEMREKGREVA